MIVLIAAAAAGYVFVKDKIEQNRMAEYRRFAGAVAETGVASELYRNDHDSFMVVRDSILNKYEMSLGDIEAFRLKFENRQEKWAEIWQMVDSLTDSLVKAQYDRLAGDSVSTADSVSDTLSQ